MPATTLTVLVTPLGEFTTTLDFNYHDEAIRRAEEEGITVDELLCRILNKAFSSPDKAPQLS